MFALGCTYSIMITQDILVLQALYMGYSIFLDPKFCLDNKNTGLTMYVSMSDFFLNYTVPE